MQSENTQYEMSPDDLTYTHEGLGAGTDIGKATVVNTIFGKARVRIEREQENSRWPWLLVALVALGIAAAIAFWLMRGAPASPETGGAAAPAAQPVELAPRTPPVTGTPAAASPAAHADATASPATATMPGANASGTALPAQSSATPKIPAPSAAKPPQPAVQQPAAPEPEKQAPAKKRPDGAEAKQPPVAARSAKPEHPAAIEQTAEMPVAVPVPAKPASPRPTLEITKPTDTPTPDKAPPQSGAGEAPPATPNAAPSATNP